MRRLARAAVEHGGDGLQHPARVRVGLDVDAVGATEHDRSSGEQVLAVSQQEAERRPVTA